MNTNLDYTAARAVRRIDTLKCLNTDKLPGSLIVTLQDDNIGSLPQVAVSQLDLLLREAAACGWEGFSTRYWPIGDLDTAAAFLARASWKRNTTPAAVYQDHFAHLYGEPVVANLSDASELLEEATILIDAENKSWLFPVAGAVAHNFKGNDPHVDGPAEGVIAIYQQCQDLLEKSEQCVENALGREYLAYWRHRVKFAIEALTECSLASKAASAMVDWETSLRKTADPQATEALGGIEQTFAKAIEAGVRAIYAMTSCIRDDSDRASLAAYYHFLVREPRQALSKRMAHARQQLSDGSAGQQETTG